MSERLRVVLLGTGGSAGVPMIGGPGGGGDWGVCDPLNPRNRRSRASIAIEGGGRTLLVDTGPDLRTQLLASRIQAVDAIVYTHGHADHITGLDDVRQLNRIAERPLEAFATAATLAELTKRFDYAFRIYAEGDYIYRPVLVPREVRAGETVEMAGFPVLLIDQDHGFSRTLGLRVGGFAYSTDVVTMNETALEMLGGLDTWVVGCFQRAAHRTHAWVDRVLEWVSILRPRRTVLTHMGPDLDAAWLERTLPSSIEPGHDGLMLDVAG